MNNFSTFMSQIPDQIMQNVEKHLYRNIGVFKPSTFVTGITMYSNEFHIIVPSSPPPDTFISKKLKSFERGKIITINPGESIYCDKNQPTNQYLTLAIKPEFINRIAEEMHISDNIRFQRLQNPFSQELLQVIRLYDIETQRADKLTLMLDCLATQLVILLLREFKINSREKKMLLPDSDAFISVAIDFMNTFYSSNISIEDICNEVNVSPYHFIRTFKKKTGFSPHQYLVQTRIKKAKELLRSRQFSVSEVAVLCGFVSLPHFSNTFKSVTGKSPSEFKKYYSINSNFKQV